ncbi:serine hydrolase [Candidatus Amarolinea dominans]|uniref:serine hydrolase n=1 Tax=Candidatus Amarolinea dominans TaxID=3140696 RepID=UPI0031CC6EE7
MTETDRDLTVSVWYPAQKSDGATAEMVYEQQFAPGEIPAFSVFGHAQLDAPPDTSGAPYPLVVYSHATWSFGQEIPYFTEHLASRGFVIISADHEDNWSTAFNPAAAEAMIRRPQEVTREIDFAESLAAAGGDLAGMINTTGVGVAGWSMGGEAALAVAGARWDLNGLRAWCADNPDEAELSVEACIEKFTALAGLEETPQGLWPSTVDERVRAVVPLSGYTTPFGSDGLQSVDVPVMFMVGSGAVAADRTFEVDVPYESVGAERKAKVVFDYGEALMFFSSCADSPSIVALGFPMFCTDPVWDMDRAHDLINHFATAFLLAELKGDADAAKALAPEKVDFPGIKYETTGYGAAPTAKLDDATVAKIEALVKEIMAKGKVPGAAVGIVKDGELVYASGFGVGKLGSDAPVTPDSVFQMSSVAKTPTAMAIMQLVADGKIDLDAPVTKYLPYFTLTDPDVGEVTIRRLLSHTAGMPDPIDWLAEYQDKNLRNDKAALDDYVRSLSDKSLTFRPGKDWSYSNTGFDILGDVVAQVSGQAFEDYLQANVLTPLGMENSSYLLSDLDPVRLVAPHMPDKNGNAKTIDFYPYTRAHAPSGAFYSSANDMARFAIANMNQGTLDGTRVLPASAYDKMWAPQATSSWAESFGPQVTSYGLGWWVGEFKGHRIIGNYGADFGSQSHLGLFPDEGLAVIALVNLFDPDVGSLYAYDIGNGIAEVLLGAEAKPTPQP